MASFENTIDVLGEELFIKNFLEKTLTEFKDSSVTKIRRECFDEFSNLTIVDAPACTEIESKAFSWCSKLETILLNGQGLSIAPYGFSNMGAKSIEIRNVSSLQESAFENLSKLANVYLPATPPTIQSSSFSSINAACVFHIPAGSLSAYQSATNWSTLTGQYTFTEDA